MMSLSPLLLVGTAPAAQAAEPAPEGMASPSGAQIVRQEVSFTVQNVNNSEIACEADGQTYTVRGHITGPQQQLEDPQAVTLFLHGLSYGEFFTTYDEQPGYDFAHKQAEAGHVTVTVDRLGYDASDKPVGEDICFGSRADVAHQIVQKLRSGEYQSGDGDGAPAFDSVVLAGHSVGAIIAQAEAYSFDDIDGLMVLSYSDTTVSDAAQQALQQAIADCEAGGSQAEGVDGPGGYVFFGDTQEKFVMAHFFTDNADPAVVETTADIRNQDPCGDITSYMTAVDANLAHIGEIDVPTLVLIGEEDAIYPIRAEEQASLLTGSTDVTTVNIADTGHALTLHYSRDQFSAEVSTWLDAHGFGGAQVSQVPVGAADTGVAAEAAPPTPGLFVLGGGLVIAAGAILIAGRKLTAQHTD